MPVQGVGARSGGLAVVAARGHNRSFASDCFPAVQLVDSSSRVELLRIDELVAPRQAVEQDGFARHPVQLRVHSVAVVSSDCKML